MPLQRKKGKVRLLVTGATGFLGARLARLLVSEGYEVVTSGRPSDPVDLISDLGCEHRPFDLEEPGTDGLERIVCGVDAVFHVAGLVSFKPKLYQAQMRVNADGTQALLRAARKASVKRFVYTSTVNALGIPEPGRVGDEETPYDWGPSRLGYMDSKHAGQQRVLQAAQEGMDALCVLPGTMFGPGDINFSAGTYIRSAARGFLLFSLPGGTTVAHVDDVARGHLLALKRGRAGRLYILGGENLPYETIFGWIADELGRRRPVATLPEALLRWAGRLSDGLRRLSDRLPVPMSGGLAKAGSSFLYYSSDRAAKELGYSFRPARQGIRDAVAYYRKHGMV